MQIKVTTTLAVVPRPRPLTIDISIIFPHEGAGSGHKTTNDSSLTHLSQSRSAYRVTPGEVLALDVSPSYQSIQQWRH